MPPKSRQSQSCQLFWLWGATPSIYVFVLLCKLIFPCSNPFWLFPSGMSGWDPETSGWSWSQWVQHHPYYRLSSGHREWVQQRTGIRSPQRWPHALQTDRPRPAWVVPLGDLWNCMIFSIHSFGQFFFTLMWRFLFKLIKIFNNFLIVKVWNNI